MSVKNTSNSINFNNNNLIFDFVFADDFLSGTLSESFQLHLPHDVSFDEFDSKAQLFVPINLFQDLFLIKMTAQDISDDVYDNAKFAVDSSKWNQQSYSIPFHSAVVDNSFAINPNVRHDKRNIQHDFVRSIYMDLTGSLKFACIFNNTNSFLTSVKELDQPLNQSITQKLGQLEGTRENPLSIHDISNNPSRDFLFGMLTNERVGSFRKEKILDDLIQNFNDRGSDTSFVSLPFHYGDGIRMKLEYHHHSGSFANKIIHPRSYIVTMFLSLESQINVGFTDISSSIPIQNNQAQLNGEYYLEMLWLGSEDRSLYYFSHYNYYPYFRHINSLSLSMNVPSVDGSGAAFVFYGRPRVYTETEDISMDKVVYFIPETNIVHDTLHTYTTNDFQVILNDVTEYANIQSFLETRIEVDVSFTPLFYYYGNQQLLSFGIGGKTDFQLNCSVEKAIIGTSDGRTITLSHPT